MVSMRRFFWALKANAKMLEQYYAGLFSYQDLCREKTQIKLRIYNADTGKHEKTPH